MAWNFLAWDLHRLLLDPSYGGPQNIESGDEEKRQQGCRTPKGRRRNILLDSIVCAFLPMLNLHRLKSVPLGRA